MAARTAELLDNLPVAPLPAVIGNDEGSLDPL